MAVAAEDGRNLGTRDLLRWGANVLLSRERRVEDQTHHIKEVKVFDRPAHYVHIKSPNPTEPDTTIVSGWGGTHWLYLTFGTHLAQHSNVTVVSFSESTPFFRNPYTFTRPRELIAINEATRAESPETRDQRTDLLGHSAGGPTATMAKYLAPEQFGNITYFNAVANRRQSLQELLQKTKDGAYDMVMEARSSPIGLLAGQELRDYFIGGVRKAARTLVEGVSLHNLDFRSIMKQNQDNDPSSRQILVVTRKDTYNHDPHQVEADLKVKNVTPHAVVSVADETHNMLIFRAEEAAKVVEFTRDLAQKPGPHGHIVYPAAA